MPLWQPEKVDHVEPIEDEEAIAMTLPLSPTPTFSFTLQSWAASSMYKEGRVCGGEASGGR